MAVGGVRLRIIGVPSCRRIPSQTAIARALRVSQATVSNALNGRRDQIATITYERIWAYANSIGYRAKGLTPEATPRKAPSQVGIVFGHDFTEWALPASVARLQWSLSETLAAAGVPCASLGSPQKFRQALFDHWTAEGAGALGLVVLGDVPTAFVKRLKPRAERIVSIGSAHPGLARHLQPDEGFWQEEPSDLPFAGAAADALGTAAARALLEVTGKSADGFKPAPLPAEPRAGVTIGAPTSRTELLASRTSHAA